MIGERLKELRKAKGLTIGNSAEIFGIANRTYSSYESEEREPNLAMLNKFADYYDVTVDYLLGRDTPIPTYLTSSELAFENALIERYKQLPEHFRKSFLQGVMEAVDYYQQELQELPQESTMVAVETAGDFRKRKEEQENDELEAQRKETA